MNNLKINWREQLINLFPDVTERVKNDNDEWCPICNGIGLKRERDHVVGCSNCYGKGIIKACECGNKIEDKYYTICRLCRSKKEIKKEKERFEKANKIKYEDYNGMFLWNDEVIDKEELGEKIYDCLFDSEEPPKYIYSTTKEKVISKIDLIDVISRECEDGYEDMNTYLDLNSGKLKQAQEILNGWIEDQGEVLYCYREDYRNVILLDSLIEEVKRDLNNKIELLSSGRLL